MMTMTVMVIFHGETADGDSTAPNCIGCQFLPLSVGMGQFSTHFFVEQACPLNV